MFPAWIDLSFCVWTIDVHVIWFWLPFPEKAVAYFETTDQILDNEDDVVIQRPPCKTFRHYVNAINTAPRNIGKDGKFQILVCLGTRYEASSRIPCLHYVLNKCPEGVTSDHAPSELSCGFLSFQVLLDYYLLGT